MGKFRVLPIHNPFNNSTDLPSNNCSYSNVSFYQVVMGGCQVPFQDFSCCQSVANSLETMDTMDTMDRFFDVHPIFCTTQN